MRFLRIAALTLCLSGGATLAHAEPQLKLPQTQIQQGHAFWVSLTADTPGDYRVEVAGQRHIMYPLPSTEAAPHAYGLLIGLPADQKPGGYTLKVKDPQWQVIQSSKIEVTQGSFYTQNIRYYKPAVTPEMQKVLDQEEAEVQASKKERWPITYWEGPFSLPVPHRISAAYGTRRYLNGKYNGYHSGTDFASPMGYPVKAPAKAKVSLARYFSKANSNGNLVMLNHGLGVSSVYLHLSKIIVKKGDTVQRGQTIGYIGSTGRSTGPHLHWGVYLNGQNTDALRFKALSPKLSPYFSP